MKEVIIFEDLDIKFILESKLKRDIEFYKSIATNKVNNETLIKFYNEVLFNLRTIDKDLIKFINKTLFQEWATIVNHIITEYDKYLSSSSNKLNVLYKYADKFIANKNKNINKNSKSLEEMTKEELIEFIKNEKF